MKKGALVISLDFELVWGIFDHIEITDKVSYFKSTLSSIPKIATLFEKYSIHATWATVGMLFNENWEEWQSNVPSLLPTYDNSLLNPYVYGNHHRNSNLDSFFFAPNIIKDLQTIPGQEIATHTYSHYYCLEKGQTVEQFDIDLQQAICIAQKFNISLQSLVFPRNQFNKDYLEVCSKNHIETVRTNPDNWYWDVSKSETLFTKIVRSADAYLPLGKKSYLAHTLHPDAVVCQPASRFLRPQHSIGLLNSARVLRINKEIIAAAKNGEVYHLWWHPHNFGVDSVGALTALSRILDTYAYCRDTYGMKSLTMKQLKDSTFDLG